MVRKNRFTDKNQNQIYSTPSNYADRMGEGQMENGQLPFVIYFRPSVERDNVNLNFPESPCHATLNSSSYLKKYVPFS